MIQAPSGAWFVDMRPGEERLEHLPCLGAEMRAAPLSEVKKTSVLSAILRSRRRLRIFPTLSSISRMASPYLRGGRGSGGRSESCDPVTSGTAAQLAEFTEGEGEPRVPESVPEGTCCPLPLTPGWRQLQEEGALQPFPVITHWGRERAECPVLGGD